MTHINTTSKTNTPAINFRVVPLEPTVYEPRIIEITLATMDHIKVFHDTVAYFDGIMNSEFSLIESKLTERFGALDYLPTSADVKMWFHEMLPPAIEQDLLFSLQSILKRLQATNITPLNGHYVQYAAQPTPGGIKVGLKLTSIHHGVALAHMLGSIYRVCNYLSFNSTPLISGMKYTTVYTSYQSIIHTEHWHEFIAAVLQPQIGLKKAVV